METKAIQKFENISEGVLARVQKMQEDQTLYLPSDYSAENAIRGAWLDILETKDKSGNAALEKCTTTSISQAMLDMVQQGLNSRKKQCVFLVYGDKLVMQRQYFGTITLAKRYADIKDPIAEVIYEGDEFEFEVEASTGIKRLVKHKSSLNNINPEKIIGAWCLITKGNGDTHLEVMSMAQIRKSWEQGASNGNSPAHKNFPDQQAKKTVINRALKVIIASSDDSVLMENVETNKPPAREVVDTEHEELPIVDTPIKVVEEPKVIEIPAEPPSPPANKGNKAPKEPPF